MLAVQTVKYPKESMIDIFPISFEDILPIWQNHLWPGRQSAIKPMSSMCLTNENNISYDMSIYEKYSVSFFGAYYENMLVGCNSGHATSPYEYRSRGLWVDPKFRGKGIGILLVNACISESEKRQFKKIWTVPRKTSLSTYQKAGFKQVSDWFDEKVEFGPNCIATKIL